MSIEWKTRDDLILPRSEWRHNQYQNQRWHSNNQRMTTSQRNTQYVTIETHFIIFSSTICLRSIVSPVVRSSVRSNPSRKSKSSFICSGSERTGSNKCADSWRNRLDAIENCESSVGCSHIGKLNDNGEMKFIILEAVQNGYFFDSEVLIIRKLESHKMQIKNRQARQRLVE